jgi:hypothetical protein
MTTTVVEIQGTLQPDGTLVLDEKPSLPPGRVRVALRPLAELAQTPVWQTLDRIWTGQGARGHVPRSREEIDADLAALRDEDEQRLREIEQLHDECQRLRQQRPSSGAP